MTASLLCLLYVRLGRGLFLTWTILSVLMPLAAPAYVSTPAMGVLFGTYFLLLNIALALMYWSPLAARFEPSPKL